MLLKLLRFLSHRHDTTFSRESRLSRSCSGDTLIKLTSSWVWKVEEQVEVEEEGWEELSGRRSHLSGDAHVSAAQGRG